MKLLVNWNEYIGKMSLNTNRWYGIGADSWDTFISNAFFISERINVCMMCILLHHSKTWLLFPELLPTSTVTSIVTGHSWSIDYKLLPFCQLKFRTTQSVRKIQVSERLPAGLSCWETEGISAVRKCNSPVFIISNLGKQTAEGSNRLGRIKVLFNPSDSLSVCQPGPVFISLQHTNTHTQAHRHSHKST